MNTVLSILNTGDACSLIALLVILVFVGGKMVEERPDLFRWGLRFSTLAFLAYGTYACFQLKPTTAEALLRITLRALMAGGLAMGPSWIALSVASFLRRYSLDLVLERIRLWQSRRQNRLKERQRQQDDAVRRQRDREEEERIKRERELQRPIQEAKARSEAEARRRRADARAACEYLYHLFSPEIGQRFTRQKFDDWMRSYLGESQPPDEVEQRAGQLRSLLEQHREKAAPTGFKNLSDLATWFAQQKQEIDSLPDPKMQQRMVAMLKERYEDLATRFFEETKL
jgi:hypothetical protein